jgi:hypothetical protein
MTEQWEWIKKTAEMQRKPWHLYNKPDIREMYEKAEKLLLILKEKQRGPGYAAVNHGSLEGRRVAAAYDLLIERQREICQILRGKSLEPRS